MVDQQNGDTIDLDNYYVDFNGVPQPRKSLSEHQYTDEQMREMKQNYLMENVIN